MLNAITLMTSKGFWLLMPVEDLRNKQVFKIEGKDVTVENALSVFVPINRG